MKRLQRGIGLLLLLAGLTAFLAPDLYSLVFQQQTKEVVREFREAHGVHEYSIENAQKSTPSEDRSSPLLKQIRQYNAEIFASRQAGLVDAWSFTENPFDFALEDDLFGCITVPAMDVELPLYLGASEPNMAKGAVVLGQTSVPVGGENTNAVIAAHRGYHGAPYFREIERLNIGDSVEVTNPWETLSYTVTDIAIIRPDDLSAVQIQEGRDLLTLITCHPYRSGGKYRYVVSCVRTGSQTRDTNQKPEDNRCEIPAVERLSSTSSEPEIQQESLLRKAGAAVIALLLLVSLLPRRSSEESKAESHTSIFKVCAGIVLVVCLLLAGLSAVSVLRTMDEAAAEYQAAIDAQKEEENSQNTIYIP